MTERDDTPDGRKACIDQSRASFRLEGIIIPEAVEAMCAAWADGQIDMLELQRRIFTYADSHAKESP